MGSSDFIDVAQTETMISLLGPAILDYTVNGRVEQPQGNLADYAAPHGVYPCRGDDRWRRGIVATGDLEPIYLREPHITHARPERR